MIQRSRVQLPLGAGFFSLSLSISQWCVLKNVPRRNETALIFPYKMQGIAAHLGANKSLSFPLKMVLTVFQSIWTFELFFERYIFAIFWPRWSRPSCRDTASPTLASRLLPQSRVFDANKARLWHSGRAHASWLWGHGFDSRRVLLFSPFSSSSFFISFQTFFNQYSVLNS